MDEEKKQKFKRKHQAENPVIGWLADASDSVKTFLADPYKFDRMTAPVSNLVDRTDKKTAERRQQKAEKSAAKEEKLKQYILNDTHSASETNGNGQYSKAGVAMMLAAIVLIFGVLAAGSVVLIRALVTPKTAPVISGADLFSESVTNGLAAVDDSESAGSGSGGETNAGEGKNNGGGSADKTASQNKEDERYADIEDTQAVLYEEANKAQSTAVTQPQSNSVTAASNNIASSPAQQTVSEPPTEIHKPVYFVERGKVYDVTDVKHAQRFSDYEHQLLIDVSSNQGRINWDRVAESGIEYALIRVGYRGRNSGKVFEDPCYEYNLRGALKAGIKVGVYFYSQAITVDEGKEEAKFLLDRIRRYDISLPVAIDYEYESMSVYGELNGRLYEAKLSTEAATNIALAFCRDVESNGYKPMVYANKDMLSNSLNSYQISGKYKIWLACYAKRATYGDEYNFWQFTDSGYVDGIRGNVCLDYWYHE